MDFSEDEDNKIEEEVDAFKSIIPPRPRNFLGGHGKLELSNSATEIRVECNKLMNDILEERIKQVVDKIFATIYENWTGQNSIVIALNMKRNQKNDLPKIIDKIHKIQKDKGTTQQKIGTGSVHEITKQDVRDIALQIQIKEDQLRENASIEEKDREIFIDSDGHKINIKKHVNIYVTRRITNLSQQNMHVFENTVINAKYVVILPTFESLKIVDGQGIIKQSQKYFFQAYNSKELFIQFFYRSIVSRHIMAYLPKQILGLIKMYDYYPISYQEGCNMLMYAVQLFNAKCEQKGKPKKKIVQMKQLIRIFNRTWKFIWNNQSEVNRYNFQILSHCILDQSAEYKISEKKIDNFIRLNTAKDTGIEDLQQKNVYETFQKKFKEKLNADESLKHLVKVLQDFDKNRITNQNIKIKKKTGANRQIGLGFISKDFKAQKHHFQQKITRLFRVATADVRRQAQYVEWSELNIFEAMCPQIVKDTVDGVMQDPDFRDVFNLIRSHSSYPMARLIDSFKKMEIGRLIYILRCLELKGLIELNKNTLKPSLITNFYDKAVYRMTADS